MNLNKILVQLQELQNLFWDLISYHDKKCDTKIKFFKQEKNTKHLLTLCKHYADISDAIKDVKLLIMQEQQQGFKR